MEESDGGLFHIKHFLSDSIVSSDKHKKKTQRTGGYRAAAIDIYTQTYTRHIYTDIY